MNTLPHTAPPNKLFLLGLVAILSLTGCKHLQPSPRPIPVTFNKTMVSFDNTVPLPKLNHSHLQENEYLLENGF